MSRALDFGRRVLNRVTSKHGDRVARELEAAIRLQPMAANSYLPWTSSSMRPLAITSLLNDIEINQRRTVVECGSGISTVFLAKALSGKQGAKFTTIDHDEKFLEIVGSWLRNYDCEHCVDLVCAPIRKLPKTFGEGEWYDTNILSSHFNAPDSHWRNATIDMLIVDGPPAWEKGREKARMPAGLYFESRLSDSFSIFLDDINRPGEREVAEVWERVFGIKLSDIGGNLGRGVRGVCYNIV